MLVIEEHAHEDEGMPHDRGPRDTAGLPMFAVKRTTFLKIFSRILLKCANSYDMVYKRFNNESGSLAI